MEEEENSIIPQEFIDKINSMTQYIYDTHQKLNLIQGIETQEEPTWQQIQEDTNQFFLFYAKKKKEMEDAQIVKQRIEIQTNVKTDQLIKSYAHLEKTLLWKIGKKPIKMWHETLNEIKKLPLIFQDG